MATGKVSKRRIGKKRGRKTNAAFMKPMTPSPVLAEIIGDKPIPRTEVVKQMWLYIKNNRLQDKRQINADEKLRVLFGGKKTVDMFEMMKLVNKNLSAVEDLGPDDGDKDAPQPRSRHPPYPRK
jgi:upstream activation factor subunit UAF30